eukprot:scaffold156269_cov36-Prasinocladus_malaysianus.AAC.1
MADLHNGPDSAQLLLRRAIPTPKSHRRHATQFSLLMCGDVSIGRPLAAPCRDALARWSDYEMYPLRTSKFHVAIAA